MQAPRRCAAGRMGSCPVEGHDGPGLGSRQPDVRQQIVEGSQRIEFAVSRLGHRCRDVVLWAHRVNLLEVLMTGETRRVGAASSPATSVGPID